MPLPLILFDNMIHFNQLAIYNNQLIIDVSVLEDTYYDNVYLDSIIIDNQDSYVSNGPSSNPVYEFTIPDAESKLTKTTYSQKHYRLVLDSSDVNLSDMLFVYVRTKGTPAADTPCGLDKSSTLGVVADMLPFYQQGMQYTKELGSTCNIPTGFTDYILRLDALKLSVKTGNYTRAIEYFNSFSSNTVPQNGGCGCGNK